MSQSQADSGEHVFVYGSLMFDEVWSRVVHGQYSSVDAILTGYRRYALQGETYPAVMPCAQSTVQGLLYLNVCQQDLARLDAFEGPEYCREQSLVTDEMGCVHRAHFYRWLLPAKALDCDWDLDDFKVRGLRRFLNTYVVKARRDGNSK